MALLLFIVNRFNGKGNHFLIALLLFTLNTLPAAKAQTRIDSLSSRQVWLAAQLLPGSGQFINKQYWKAPVFYAGMGTMLYFGLEANNQIKSLNLKHNQPFNNYTEYLAYKEQRAEIVFRRNIYFSGAAAFYVTSIADALIVHAKGKHSPAAATILSALAPGMGQVYNGRAWKVPFVWGGMASLYYLVDSNNRGFKRAGIAYKQFPYDEFEGKRSKADLLFYRDSYRRNRDLSIIALAGFYALNIIDAYVDANFFDWDISDDLALNLEPTIFNGYMANNLKTNPTFGLKINLNFK